MTAEKTELWQVFDEAELRRRGMRVRQQDAFRQLDVSASDLGHLASVRAWDEYCRATQALNECVAELESLVWQLSR